MISMNDQEDIAEEDVAEDAAEEETGVEEAKAARKTKHKSRAAKVAKPKPEAKKPVLLHELKLFDKWPSEVQMRDIGLKSYVNTDVRLLPRSAGVFRER